MSASVGNSAIFMTDTLKQIKTKVCSFIGQFIIVIMIITKQKKNINNNNNNDFVTRSINLHFLVEVIPWNFINFVVVYQYLYVFLDDDKELDNIYKVFFPFKFK